MYDTQKLEEKERAMLVGVKLPGISSFLVQDLLDELKLLAETAGAEVVDWVVQERKKLDPAFLIGKGKVKEIKELSQNKEANLIIFDDDLTPAQLWNLQKEIGLKIIDRSCLILDIFAKRAKTKEAKAQVSLAQLKYLLPGLTRKWTHFSRQYGGIGTKGPGETQLETDRRLTRKRIKDLEKVLQKIDKEKQNQRKKRLDLFKIALVGYTNAGKSTLFNQLTSASADVGEKLFSTLDPTTRVIRFSKNNKIVLTDTIGFIRKLPHHLIASFRSTLDEVRLADLILHVVDFSHPDFIAQIQKVNEVLEELDSLDKPTLMVYNKIDKLDGDFSLPVSEGAKEGVFISAKGNIGVDELFQKIDKQNEEQLAEAVVELQNSELHLLPALHRIGVITEKKFGKEKSKLKIRCRRWALEKMCNSNHKVTFSFI
jgi:GTP-binding protein HflX